MSCPCLPAGNCCPGGRDFVEPGAVHLENNVLDETDVINFSNKVLRKIEFKHDYSLQPETPNSIRNEFLYTASPPTQIPLDKLTGKLTLNSLGFRGKDGAIGIPDIKFSYDIKTPKSGSGAISSNSGHFILESNNSLLETGDLIKPVAGLRHLYS